MDILTVEENINDLDAAMWVLKTVMSRRQYEIDRLGQAPLPEVDAIVGEILGCEGIKDMAAASWRGIQAIFKKIFEFLGNIARALGGLFKRNKAIRTDFDKKAEAAIEHTRKNISDSHRSCMAASKNVAEVAQRSADLDKLFTEIDFGMVDRWTTEDKKDNAKVDDKELDEALAAINKGLEDMHDELISRCIEKKPIDVIKADGKETEVYLQNLGDGTHPNLIFIVKKDGVVEDITPRRASDKENTRYRDVFVKHMREADEFNDIMASLDDINSAADKTDAGDGQRYADTFKKQLSGLEKQRAGIVRNMEDGFPEKAGRALLRTVDRRIRHAAAVLKALGAEQHMVAKQVQAANVIMLDAVRASKEDKDK